MVIDERTGIETLDELPEGYVKVNHFFELLKFKEGKRVCMGVNLKNPDAIPKLIKIEKNLRECMNIYAKAKVNHSANRYKKWLNEIYDYFERLENVQLIIYSPTSKKYYPDILVKEKNFTTLVKYLNDGNLYIKNEK